jgi:hypothetical protein
MTSESVSSERSDAEVGGDAEGVAGAVVEPAEDLHVGAGEPIVSGEAVVGEVGLPALVGEVGLEADIGGAGSLLGGRHDEPGAARPRWRMTGKVGAPGGGPRLTPGLSASRGPPIGEGSGRRR